MLKHFSLPLVLSVVIILATSLVLLFSNRRLTTKNQQLSSGCYYQQVQCIRAPCDPILVCPTIYPTPEVIPTPPFETLQTKELSNGDIKITNPTYGFEIVVPVTYGLSGNSQSFSVGFNGPDSGGPPPRDLSGISFRIGNLTESTLTLQAQKESPNESHIFSPVTLNNFSGYKFSCPFLVSQECYYLNLTSGKYLSILTKISDDNNRGYQKEINKILSSLKKISPTPTCRPRPKCLDTNPRCLIPETPDMCPPETFIHECPPSGWVDCMPSPDQTKPQCQKDYLDWIKVSCPDFQGVAY